MAYTPSVRRSAWPIALGAALLWAPGGPDGLRAQTPEPASSRFSGGFSVLNTQPLGDLATGPGFGIDLSAAWALDPGQRLRLRGEVRASVYGRDTERLCLSGTVGCLIQVDVNTDYSAYYIGAGPELAIPVFGMTVVLDATAGVGGFSVASSVEGTSDVDGEDLFRTDHFNDTFFAWSTGGELRIPVSAQLSISAGAHYQHNGEASYVPEGGITQNPDGSLDVNAITTDANQVVFTIGVAFHPSAGWTDEPDDE